MTKKEKNIKRQIDAYIKGKLTEEEISELWVEFAKEPHLLADLELEVGVYEILKQDLSTSSKSSAKVFALPTWTWHAAAAAVILMVAFVQLFHVPNKTTLDQFVIAEIGVDQLETSDGIRAKDAVVLGADSILNLGFSEMVAGNSDRAMILFNDVITGYDFEPYGSKAYLNKGILFYNSADYDSAIVSFEAAIQRVNDSKMIEEKAYWYLGNTYVNVSELEKAREIVHQAYALDGVFRQPAFLLLQKLNYDLGYADIEETED